MKYLDRFLQQWRIHKVKDYIKPGMKVLDIGCGQGELFQIFKGQLTLGLGIDPLLDREVDLGGNVRLLPGNFPDDAPELQRVDLVIGLALLEHIPEDGLDAFVNGIRAWLNPGGQVVLTVPSPMVDPILAALKFLRWIDGMSLEEHHGYDVGRTELLFNSRGFKLIRHEKFQLGLNNLFVFEKAIEE